jgi:hypothetical protein
VVHALHPLKELKRLPFCAGNSYGFKKIWRRGHLQWNDPTSEFHENLLNGSKFAAGGNIEE